MALVSIFCTLVFEVTENVSLPSARRHFVVLCSRSVLKNKPLKLRYLGIAFWNLMCGYLNPRLGSFVSLIANFRSLGES
jgi:hypothetical protein